MTSGRILLACLGLALLRETSAAEAVDRLAPDFVQASVLLASPGEDLFSSSGHLCLRLVCKTYALDNCFSYEHEKSLDPFFSTFFERLRMGLFVKRTEDYLQENRAEGRGVTEYPLDLPSEMKIRLWRLLDQTAERGAEFRYDYIGRACSVTSVDFLRHAALPRSLTVSDWPAKFAGTRREVCAQAYGNSPWKACLLHLALGTAFDVTRSDFEKLLIPADAVEVLSHATIDGRPVLDPAKAVELVSPSRDPSPAPLISPIAVAGGLFLLALVNGRLRNRWIDRFFLALLVPPALFLGYLYFFTQLPMTNWNWMIVPVNLLPVLAWRWRRHWALPFAGILILWELFVVFSPHQLMHPSFPVFVAAYIVLYLRQSEKVREAISRFFIQIRRKTK